MRTAKCPEAGFSHPIPLDPERELDFGPLLPVARPAFGDGRGVRQVAPARQGVQAAPNLEVVPRVVRQVGHGAGARLTRPEPDDLVTHPRGGLLDLGLPS